MFVLVRAVVYSALFIGFLLVYLPTEVLLQTGLGPVPARGPWQIPGMVIAGGGMLVCLWCIFTFVFLGKGTPAPFDPPRRLVIRGPYRFVRNPMYVGAGLALAGAALSYQSLPLLGYTAGFLVVMHLFVLIHEEPALRQSFGSDYEAYCAKVGRWWPRF